MKLQKSSEEILNQLLSLLEKMEPQQYFSPVDTLSQSSIGAHVRHIIEFYQCLLEGLLSGEINYDSRQRHHLIETDLYFAKKCIVDIVQKINDKKTDCNLKIAIDLSTENDPVIIDTTFNRELAYNIEHAIHHMAIIRIGINTTYPSVAVNENFGVAYSTMNFNKQNKY